MTLSLPSSLPGFESTERTNAATKIQEPPQSWKIQPISTTWSLFLSALRVHFLR